MIALALLVLAAAPVEQRLIVIMPNGKASARVELGDQCVATDGTDNSPVRIEVDGEKMTVRGTPGHVVRFMCLPAEK